MENERRPYTLDRVVRILFTLAGIVGAVYLLDRLKGALLPFLIAWLIAYLLEPICSFIQQRVGVKSRALAVMITLVGVIALLVGIGFVFIPSIIAEVAKTNHLIHTYLESNRGVNLIPQEWISEIEQNIRLDNLANLLDKEEWKELIENGLTQAWNIISGSVTQIMNVVGWLIVLLYLVFIMLDYNKILNGFKSLIPSNYREITLSILQDVESGMNRYFRGQSLIALLVGILFSIGFVIIELPLAIPLGLGIGLLNLVPYLQIVGILPTILLCLLRAFETGQNFWIIFTLAMGVFAVVQLIQDILITPTIMGKVTGLNPAVILLSLSVWGTLLGILGMIIALPLTSIMLSYYSKYILKESKSENSSENDKVEVVDNKDIA